MKVQTLLKSRVWRACLFAGACLLAAGIYLGDYLDGHGSWPVVTPTRITVIGPDCEQLLISGDYRMTPQDRVRLGGWLESQGFVPSKSDGKMSAILAYRGRYNNSLPITVTITPDPLDGTDSIVLSYGGHGFRRLFEERRKKVGMFSNEMLRQAAKNVHLSSVVETNPHS